MPIANKPKPIQKKVDHPKGQHLSIEPELSAVAARIMMLDPKGARTARVLRDTFDQLYDGKRTGRYRWDQLYNTERMKGGDLVEINLHREFKFQDGLILDYRIAGIEVDCKFSQKLGSWMIPPEVHGHLCLLIWTEDTKTPTWCMGLVRISVERLNAGGNRDAKSTLNEAGRKAITWLFRNEPLPSNVLLQLDVSAVENLMAQNSGQKRINELFRAAVGRTVCRAVIATVGQQDDYMKRVRANGGARTTLRSEGIVILGQYASHATIARALGVPVPGRGESVSVRIVPAQSLGIGVAKISGRLWRVAQEGDPVVCAPKLPEIKLKSKT